jgi:hypothetical protein
MGSSDCRINTRRIYPAQTLITTLFSWNFGDLVVSLPPPPQVDTHHSPLPGVTPRNGSLSYACNTSLASLLRAICARACKVRWSSLLSLSPTRKFRIEARALASPHDTLAFLGMEAASNRLCYHCAAAGPLAAPNNVSRVS